MKIKCFKLVAKHLHSRKNNEKLGQKCYYVESIDRACLRFELLSVTFLLIKSFLKENT